MRKMCATVQHTRGAHCSRSLIGHTGARHITPLQGELEFRPSVRYDAIFSFPSSTGLELMLQNMFEISFFLGLEARVLQFTVKEIELFILTKIEPAEQMRV